MTDAKFLRGIKFLTRIFFNISALFNKVEDMSKINCQNYGNSEKYNFI